MEISSFLGRVGTNLQDACAHVTPSIQAARRVSPKVVLIQSVLKDFDNKRERQASPPLRWGSVKPAQQGLLCTGVWVWLVKPPWPRPLKTG